jgi:hypothetical protein
MELYIFLVSSIVKGREPDHPEGVPRETGLSTPEFPDYKKLAALLR